MLLYLFLLICSGCLVILNLSSVPVLINMLEFFRLSIIAFLLWLVVRMFSIVQYVRQLTITARQYGEVVLPDASTGQNPGTPSTRGQKAVTVQGGYGALFAVMV